MSHKVIDSSVKSILNVSIPILLTTLAANLMYVVDRFMLAGYSVDSMNAANLGGNFIAIFTFMFVGIAASAEVFVGQYNGSKQFDKLASPVWQMLYLSWASMLFCFPIAYFSEYINFFPSYYMEEGVVYQKILMYFGFLPSTTAAASAFFVGQGKTRVVTFAITFGTLLNILLDYLLIYGVQDVIPAMGVKGAAIATVISEMSQIAILLGVFFNKTNRRDYKTATNYGYNKEVFAGCAKIGLPISIGHFVALAAWYAIQILMSYTSKDMATIYGIALNVYILFIFIGEGLSKSASTITANMIGRNDLQSIKKTCRIFCRISISFGVVMAIPLVIFPDWTLKWLDLLPDNISRLYDELKIVFYLQCVNISMESLFCVFSGILIAGGDSKYPTIVNQCCIWSMVVLPTLILYKSSALNSASVVYMFIFASYFITTSLVYRRYRSMKWYNKLV